MSARGLSGCFVIFVVALAMRSGAAEEYVRDPELEKLIAAATDPDQAVAFAARKVLSSRIDTEKVLNKRLFDDPNQQNRRNYAELIARCCAGRVGYRVTLELNADGSGRVFLESDRSMLAECAQKYDRLQGKTPTVFPPDELRRNPYGKVELAKHVTGAMKYEQGSSMPDKDGRIIANGEVSFTEFDDFASFATSFDKLGYHMLNGISLIDNNGLRTLRFRKNPENSPERATTFLQMFHDVKWEFVLDFKGQLKNHNASLQDGTKKVWRFNCAQMLNGEASVEASYGQGPVAAVANKVLTVAVGKPFDPKKEPNPNKEDTVAVLDGSASEPRGSLLYQWVQTQGSPLGLSPESLARPVIKLRFYEVGKYAFELRVSQNGTASGPAEVVINVIEPQSNGADGSVRPPVELDKPIVKNVPEASKPIPPEPAPEAHPPEASAPAVRPEASAPVAAQGILLDEIRQEEMAYNKRVAMQKGLAPQPPVAANPQRNEVAPAPVEPPVHAQPALAPADKQGKGVDVAARIELDEIRNEEAAYNRAHPSAKKAESGSVPRPNNPVPTQPGANANDKPDVSLDVPVKDGNADKLAAEQAAAKKRAEEDAAAAKKAELERVAAEQARFAAAAEAKRKADEELAAAENAKKEEALKKEAAAAQARLEEASKKAAAKRAAEDDEAKRKAEAAALAKTGANPAVPAPAVKPDASAAPNVATPAPAAPVTGGNTLEAGLKLLKGGQYAAAVEVLKAAAQASPSDEQVQMNLGIALFEASDKPDGYDRAGTQAALDKFNDVLSINSKNAEAYMYAGHCNARLDRAEDKMRYYKTGYMLGKDKVEWEIHWILGNRYLKGQDYASAMGAWDGVEEDATKAGVKDPRLLRDLALAFHGLKKDAEAVKRINALWELGYLPDRKLVDELRAALPNDVKVPASAYAQNVAAVPAPAVNSVAAVKAPAPGNDTVPDNKSNPPAVVNPPAATAQNVKTDVDVKPAQPAVAAPGNAAVAAQQPGPKPAPEAPKHQMTVADLNNMDASQVKTNPRPPTASRKAEQPKEPARVARPLPPIPANYDDALAAGKRALARGEKLADQFAELTKANAAAAGAATSETPKAEMDALKNDMLDCWDEAEAMFRGAWNMKPGDKEVDAQLELLAKHINVIALPMSPVVLAKPNGLIVLNAEPSIVFPKEKQMYYVWSQVVGEGPDLNLRREDLTKKTVGLRIKDPGSYKFELVVSDGVHGGNPVTVTVEVH